jgi:hypothetical protein
MKICIRPFGIKCRLRLHAEDGGITFLRNLSKYIANQVTWHHIPEHGDFQGLF